MQPREQLYAGKAKTVYTTESPDLLVMEYRNDTSAFDGKKTAQLASKGRVNNQFNAFIMDKLQAAGIPTHFERLLSSDTSLVRKLDMIPVECVVRNYAAGSLCRRLGIEEGFELDPPVFEFFLKNDELGDPMITESHITTFGWATDNQIQQMKVLSIQVNHVLKGIFRSAGMLLVDYKLEFGEFRGKLLLGDEFSPDGCRLWDAETKEKLDKDRFRLDLGDVVESYQAVGHRLGIEFKD